MFDLIMLSKGFKGDIVTPSDPDYAESIARWATNAVKKAKIVAFVKDAEDVSLGLKFAKDNKLDLAIKGGGHSSAGASSSEGGIVIDLSRHMNGVKIDTETKLGYVGGGAVWGDLDKAAIEHGLAGVAGTVNHTGVGGLTLGGGFGWLSGAHGYVVDNVVQVTIVTADGSTRIASSTENTDLFWGIRGGGCNFGVVTEFVYKLHSQRRTVYAGVIMFAPNALEKLGPVIEEWWKDPDEKAGMTQILSRGPDGNPAVIIILFYNGTETEGKTCFKAFFEIGPVMNVVNEMPYEMVNALHNPHVPHGVPTYMKGVRATKPRLEVAQKVFQTLIDLTENHPGFSINCAFEYIPLAKVCSIANDATACIRLPYNNVLVIIRWPENTGENLKLARDASRKLTDIVLKANVELTDAENTIYGNYDPETAVGNSNGEMDHKPNLMSRENYPRLQALKKKYDPEMLFSKWFAITPA